MKENCTQVHPRNTQSRIAHFFGLKVWYH